MDDSTQQQQGQQQQQPGEGEGDDEEEEQLGGAMAELPGDLAWTSSRRELGDEGVWTISTAKPGEEKEEEEGGGAPLTH
jgi:hypothetical protein